MAYFEYICEVTLARVDMMLPTCLLFFLYPVLVFKVLRLSLNRGRQHMATPLKTCHNIEAGFLTGWLLCLSPNSEVTASETPPFPHLGCVPAVPPSHDDNFARTSVCR